MISSLYHEKAIFAQQANGRPRKNEVIVLCYYLFTHSFLTLSLLYLPLIILSLFWSLKPQCTVGNAARAYLR